MRRDLLKQSMESGASAYGIKLYESRYRFIASLIAYESILQLKLEKLNSPGMDMWSFPMDMKRWGAGGALVKMDGFPSGGNSTLVYFSCEDCAIEESRAEKSGGRIQRKKISIGEYGFISLIFDTEGNMVGLHSMK